MPHRLLAAASTLSELPERLIATQTRTAVALGRVPVLDRLPLGARARLAQLGGGALLLTIGTLIGSVLLWALLAVPLVAIVMLILIELEERRSAATRAPREFVGVSWVARPVDEVPIVVRRGTRRPETARPRERRQPEHAAR
jgi:hypothetical protein